MWKSILSPKHLSPTVATIMIVLSTIGFGLQPLFAKTMSNAGLASSAVVFYRYLLTGLLLLPVLTFVLKKGETGKRVATFWMISAGLAGGLSWIAYLEALKSAPVATVGVIYMTYPLFTLLITMILLRQVPERRSILAGLLILVAALIPLSPASLGTNSLTPLILAFLTPLAFGYGITILTNKTAQLAPLECLAAYSFGGTLGLLPLLLPLELSAVIPSRLADWMLVLGIAIVTFLLPNFFYVMGAPLIGSARAAIAGSFELPVMFVVGWLAFGEEITLLQSVAGLLVLIAIWITSVEPSDDHSEEVEVVLPPTSANTTALS